MDKKEEKTIKEVFLSELEKMIPKERNLSLIKISENFEIEYSKKEITIKEEEVMNHCNLDFEINLITNKNKPCSNHLIGHIIIGGLRIKGMPMNKNPNDLWKGNLGICLLNNNNLCHLISYNFSFHLNDDTFNQACKKCNLNFKKSDFDDREIAQYAFYNKGFQLTQ